MGYRIIGIIQLVLTVVIVLSLPLWKTKTDKNAEEQTTVPAKFLTLKLNDAQMVCMGLGFIAIGIVPLILPLGETVTLVGLLLISFGCAPIYPSIIHATPSHLGAENAQAIIGVQIASAYIGNCLMPPLFGVIANHTTIAILPYYLLAILILMGYMHETLQKREEAAR